MKTTIAFVLSMMIFGCSDEPIRPSHNYTLLDEYTPRKAEKYAENMAQAFNVPFDTSALRYYKGERSLVDEVCDEDSGVCADEGGAVIVEEVWAEDCLHVSHGQLHYLLLQNYGTMDQEHKRLEWYVLPDICAGMP